MVGDAMQSPLQLAGGDGFAMAAAGSTHGSGTLPPPAGGNGVIRERRLELRYTTMAPVAEIASMLSHIADREKFERDFTTTVYFDTEDCGLPFELSLKARNYAAAPLGAVFALDPTALCRFDVKEGFMQGGWYVFRRNRTSAAYGEIPSMVPFPVRPMYATCYPRQHWRLKDDPRVRITLDGGVGLYAVENWRGSRIKTSEGALIELKLPLATVAEKVALLQDMIRHVRGVPSISKKDLVHNAYNAQVKARSGRPPTITDTEIEAKLSLSGSQQDVFPRIKRDIAQGHIPGFRVHPDFPLTLERATISAFIISPNGEYHRTLFDGSRRVRNVTKKMLSIFPDRHGLHCIIMRKEFPADVPAELQGLPTVTMYRKRKYFLIMNDRGEQFSVLMDRSAHDGRVLYQVEIEWIAMQPSDEERDRAAADIAEIAKHIVEKYGLTPTTLTKLEWLRGQERTPD
jgi:hypothetical protein